MLMHFADVNDAVNNTIDSEDREVVLLNKPPATENILACAEMFCVA